MPLLPRTHALALAATLAGLVGLASPAHAAFVEDFSTFANDPATNNLSGAGAGTNGWTFVNASRFNVSGGILYNGVGSGQLPDKTAGKPHGLDLANANRVDLTVGVGLAKVDNDVMSQAQVWLADANQNGYGITVERNAAGNSLVITKLRNGTAAFGSARNATRTDAGPAVAFLPPDADTSIRTLHLTLEQAGPGGDVVLTAWSTAIPTSSYDAPLLRVTDTGAGGAFDSPVFSLGSLTHAALALKRYHNSGGVARIDNLQIDAVIPEPAAAALLGVGSALVLGRNRFAN